MANFQETPRKRQAAMDRVHLMLDRMKDTDDTNAICAFTAYTDEYRLLYSGTADNGSCDDAAFFYRDRDRKPHPEEVEKGALYLQKHGDSTLRLTKLGKAVEKNDLANMLMDYFYKEGFSNSDIRRTCATAEKMRAVTFNPENNEFYEGDRQEELEEA